MSGLILGPKGEQIDLTHSGRGFTKEQLQFIANNAPRLGDLPADATQQSRSQRQLLALQQGLFKLSQDNYQLWMLLAAMLARLGARDVGFDREDLAKFVDPRSWPTVEARPNGDGLDLVRAKPFVADKETPSE